MTHEYAEPVRRDLEWEARWRETYIDLTRGNEELTLGDQQVVWGEVVGLFVADIVTAKDFREFILPSFEYIRIPQWAARFQHYEKDTTLEVVWIPFPAFDQFAVPGSEFAFRPPVPSGAPFVLRGEETPPYAIANSEVGIRWSSIVAGWNPALFYLYGFENNPAFLRSIGPGPVILLTPFHPRVHEAGYTVSKDFDGFVVRSEGVLTLGERFSVTDPLSETGLSRKNFFQYVLGGSPPTRLKTSLNVQIYQNVVVGEGGGIIGQKPVDTGATIWLNPEILGPSLSPELLYLHDFSGQGWMFRAKLAWTVSDSWLFTVGGDLFGGDLLGLYGQFSHKRRVYSALRYNF